MLLAAGGIAIVINGDGVGYVGPGTRIAETGGLTLVVQESSIGICLEVRTAAGEMAGGCGEDFGEPIGVNVGFVAGKSFASGWAPPGTAEIEMTFREGETMIVTTFEAVAEHDI